MRSALCVFPRFPLCPLPYAPLPLAPYGISNPFRRHRQLEQSDARGIVDRTAGPRDRRRLSGEGKDPLFGQGPQWLEGPGLESL